MASEPEYSMLIEGALALQGFQGVPRVDRVERTATHPNAFHECLYQDRFLKTPKLSNEGSNLAKDCKHIQKGIQNARLKGFEQWEHQAGDFLNKRCSASRSLFLENPKPIPIRVL